MRAVLALSVALLVGCGRQTSADPFVGPAPDAAGGASGEGGLGGAAGAAQPPLDGAQPCSDDTQCDDQVDCTDDSCDTRLGRCRHEPDDAACDDGIYCDGRETCSVTLGCRRGPAVSCSDEDSCSIDTCVEETQSCEHETRDADGDGDPPIACHGTDCNDFDPLVSGTTAERCGNQVDDDCDGQIDEADCVMPEHDRCGDALEIDAPGSYSVSTIGAAQDYAVSCEAALPGRAFRDLVLAITVPGDVPQDVDIAGTMTRAAPAPVVASLTPSEFAKASKVHAVAMPEQVNAGELLVALFSNDGTTDVKTPAGWAPIFTTVHSSYGLRASAFFSIATGAEAGGTVNFATTDAALAAAQVYRITRWAGVGAGLSARGGPEGTGTDPDPPAEPLPWNDIGDSLWIAVAAGTGTFAVDAYPMEYTGGTLTSSGEGSAAVQVASAVRALDADPGDPGAFALDQSTSWLAATIVVKALPHTRLDPGELVLAGTNKCGKAAEETACTGSVVAPSGDSIARLVLRNLEPGPHAVYVAADREADVELHVDFRDPEPVPSNETCGTSQALTPDVPVRVVLAQVATDLETTCAERTGELVYRFVLKEASDVRLDSVALDDYGAPVVSLRDATCTEVDSELTCRAAAQSELFARALPAGTYTVSLGGTGPAEVELVLHVSPATPPTATEGCTKPPQLELGVTEQVSLADATDAVQIGCLVGAPDATYALDLPVESDLMLLETGSSDDTGSVLIAQAPCATAADALVCASSDQWPVRAVAHALGPGEVRAVVETDSGNPTTLTAFARPAVPSVFVQGADECADAFEIPETGGRFAGNTANQYAEYDASCDYGGQPAGAAPEQMLKLTLTARRRVVLDTTGSSYATLIVLRDASSCPGDEVAGTCSVTYTPSHGSATSYAFIDTVLDAGTYFVQIDGYDGEKGRWALELFTSEVSGG